MNGNSRTARLALLFIATLAFAGAMFWFGLHLAAPKSRPENVGVVSTVARGDIVRKRTSMRRTPRHTRNKGLVASMALLTALPDQILSVNLVPAERGNPGAMREIGEAIQRCAYAVTTSNTKFEAQQIDAQLRSEAAANRSGRPVTTAEEAQKVEKAVENKKALDESCSHIDPKQIGSGLRWLERAADAGDLQAMRDYIQTAFDGYLEHGMQPSDLDEAKRRRDRVRQYAEDLLSQGDCNALASLQWATPNPAQAYAYRLAFAHWLKQDAASIGTDPRAFEASNDYLARQAASLSPAQVAEAHGFAENLVRTHCVAQ